MSNLYKMFESDVDLELEGITVNYGSVKFQLARAGGRNKAFKDAMNSRASKYRTQLQHETLEDEVAEQILFEAYAEAVVIGWWSRKEDAKGQPILTGKKEEQWDDHVVLKDGSKAKFSRPACIALFKELPDLFSDIQVMASKAANFRKLQEEADEGNSAKS